MMAASSTTSESNINNKTDEEISGVPAPTPTALVDLTTRQPIVIETPRNKRSWVWTYFGQKVCDFQNEVVTCKLCLETVCYKTQTTTNMHAHLARKRKDVTKKQVEAKKAKKSVSDNVTHCKQPEANTPSFGGQMRLTNAGSLKLSATSGRAKAITSGVACFIAKDLRPYSVVENSGFRNLMKILEPRYDMPSRNHFTNMVIPAMYKTIRTEVESIVKGAPAVALTTDGWTSISNDNYLTFTAHLIDEKFVAKSYILSTVNCESHTSINLQAALQDVLKEWGLKMKGPWAPTVTTDNASNVTLSIRLASLINIRCLAHKTSINLAVQKVLKVDRVNKSLSRVRAIVRHFHRSPKATAVLRRKQLDSKTDDQVNTKPHKLILDVSTR